MDTSVIIAGAGPAGLTLSAELRLAGVDVIVLEKLREPTGQSRGLGFTGRTMEVFDQRGLLPLLPDLETSNVGHYGGLGLDFSVIEGAHWVGKDLPQARTEEMLTEWAVGLGADIRRGHEVVALSQDDQGVAVEVDGPGGRSRFSAQYLVGCDGGRSSVRKLAGFDFPGLPATLEMFIADVKGADIEPRWTGETRPNGMVMAGPLNDEITRIVVCEKDHPPPAERRTEPPSFAEVAGGWERLTGQDISHGTAAWVTSFGNATRQVTEYRRGRVLLAGDAAHIHLPAGGQGMNTGIQDAMNLGWKLAAQVHGTAPGGLLDSYHTERHRVAERVLTNTRAQGLLFLNGDEMQPLRDVLTELIQYPEVSRHLVGSVSGIDIRYDMGTGDHPLLGARMRPGEEIDTDGGRTRVGELLHAGRGVLLDLTGDAAVLREAAGWADRVDAVTGRPRAESELAGTEAVLIRPDGHVAWAAPGCGPADRALRRWFGAPAAGRAAAGRATADALARG
ncbi:FAD-dependent monooxygenase [Actinomadura sp. 7K507]|uniref:FAD-dependent monooxygenase n=1 Tax=Actinomadura sp. 7K507 TaxID=2530365 RepID=UPI0010470D9A|nr:FAD-dependent monooxygenase [Actinomadura sp. 7K507]TDC97202.1 monooxygenase [Actinomadura sp. 7K507]